MVVEGGIKATLLKVPFEPSSRRLVQGYESALAKET
jgi:hypothetical protein